MSGYREISNMNPASCNIRSLLSTLPFGYCTPATLALFSLLNITHLSWSQDIKCFPSSFSPFKYHLLREAFFPQPNYWPSKPIPITPLYSVVLGVCISILNNLVYLWFWPECPIHLTTKWMSYSQLFPQHLFQDLVHSATSKKYMLIDENSEHKFSKYIPSPKICILFYKLLKPLKAINRLPGDPWALS